METTILQASAYGVRPDTQELQTEAFQKAIDHLHSMGGGELQVQAGTYHIGSIRLYSDMTLHLMEGAKLYGSRDFRDYTDFKVPTTLRYVEDEHYKTLWNLPDYYIYGIICAFGEKQVSIIGEPGSEINGQDCFDPDGEEGFRGPMGMIFCSCQNVTLKGYTVSDSANWSHQLDSCKGVDISQVTVLAGHDGFNFHHCTGINVSGCRLYTGDDCVAGYDIENLYVKDCFFNTACNALRIGGRNMIFDHCTFKGPGLYPHRSEMTYYTHAVFKYYSIRPDVIRGEGEGILLKNCTFTDMTMLLSYQYGREELMQNNLPLRELTFEDADIKHLTKKSLFKGNGEPCTLTLRRTALSFEGSDDEDPMLEVDSSITLNLEQVICAAPVIIQAPKDTVVNMKDCKGIRILRI